MTAPGEVKRIEPASGIPGGEVTLEYETVPAVVTRELTFSFDDEVGHVTAAGKTRALVRLPEINSPEPVSVATGISEADAVGSGERFVIGRKLARGIHPVANPAFEPHDGSLYVTRSGSRGEHVPVSIFRIGLGDTVEDFSA